MTAVVKSWIRPASLVLGVLACGPPQAGVNTTAGTTSETSTTEVEPGTESEDTTEVETSDADTTDDTTFVPAFDLPPEPVDCDIFLQDCAEGQKCVPYGTTGGGWDKQKCVPVLGDQTAGEPCSYGGIEAATDNCDATSFCWDVIDIGGEPSGVCHPLCSGTPDDPECPPGSACVITSSFQGVCVIHPCDPLLQDCYQAYACLWEGVSFGCHYTAEVPAGEPCGYITDCAGGLVCTDAPALPECAAMACCSPFCQLGLGDAQCDALPGTSCVAFFEQDMAPVGFEHIGVCLSP